MKRSYVGVLLLCLVVLMNIIFTQYAVNFFYAQKYINVILLSLGNVGLFPIAWLIYKKEKNQGGVR
ncbi:hypothetical protein [Brevibacillus dissolubilis]|uniref:hypothetical protein n=1 Tax=Brevibacillus dissolubilis TaxID=1844116 RepID=UPI0011177677|nr:hypothetical protein [Brevibacillus dissolubilis]